VIKETPGKERRHFSRVILQRVITYEAGLLPAKRGHSLTGKQFRGYLLNISNGGICFRTRQQLHKKMVLKISLPVNDISPKAPTLAQVLWVRKNLKRKEYQTGLRFII
jgi:c-di-GMP-binding flagellar brake protein YcgR